MYILLSGAKKNAGDFLIFDRAKALLEEHLDEEFITFPRWEALDDKLDVVNKSKGIIICGGPGYGNTFYPIIYRLTSPLSKLKVPIIPMGLGYSGTPTNIEEFTFTKDSLETIKYIHSQISNSCVRDVLTKKLLENNSVKNVILSGCPAWYSLEDIDKEFVPPKEVKKIVFTTPAKIKYAFQTIRAMSLIRRKFPKAEVLCSFHRGLTKDKYTKRRSSYTYQVIAAWARLLRFKVQDFAYGAEGIEVYREYDLHVGYRVHSHIYFLSIRKPTILLQEDGRGKGLSLTINSSFDVSAYEAGTIQKLRRSLRRVLGNDFDEYYTIIDFMKETYQKGMIPFLNSLK